MIGQDDHILTLAKMPPLEAAARLRAIGEDEAADALESADREQPKSPQAFGVSDWLKSLFKKPWWPTEPMIGYFSPSSLDTDGTIRISDPGPAVADPTLKKAALRITLDRFYVAEYPGKGKHQVLLHFTGVNQVRGRASAEEVHFNTTCEVSNGRSAGDLAIPIFTGLRVGKEGIVIHCETINVKSQYDQNILDIVKSPALKNGIQLFSTVQPALVPLSGIATKIVELLCQRTENVPVFSFQLGLDFRGIPTRYSLAEGSYIVIQLSLQAKQLWNWNEWAYHSSSHSIINKSTQQLIPCNYFIFGISRYESE